MTDQTYTVEVQGDFLERQAAAHPVQALAELIWNGLDADASRVDVYLEHDELGVSRILVRDDGDGMPHADARTFFTRLGGSWKKPGMRTKKKGRMVHGHEGRGRFKAFALGRVAEWHVTYKRGDGSLYAYDVTILEDRIQDFRVSDERPIAHGKTGIEVVVSELHKAYRSIEPEHSLHEFSEIFALYLKSYRDVVVNIEGRRVDPAAAIASSDRYQLKDIVHDDVSYPAELEIVEWRTATTRTLYLCTAEGFPFSKASERRFHVGDYQFSAYLKSTFVTELNKLGQLELAEMNPALNQAIDESQESIKAYFRDRAAARARAVVDEWIEEKIYPYEGTPQTVLEGAERKVFEIVAVTASDLIPEFRAQPVRQKAYHLRMLRTALEKSPKELQIIMNEVLGLPKRKQEELAALLEETSLSSIIEAAKEVADRLKFVFGLEQILFDPEMKQRLKERTQLHQILADNTWIFGEEYNIAASDKSLTAVLHKHRKLLGDVIVIDKPVSHYSKKRGIIDLMLSRVLRRHRADELEHLVVELKAPKVVLGMKQVNQIEEYAFAVANDERFNRTAVKWVFWLISDRMNDFAKTRILEGEEQRGTIHRKGNVVIAIKTWQEVIEDNKARLQFFQEKLQHQVDDDASMKFLTEKYKKFLEGVVSEDDDEPEEPAPETVHVA